jgi:parallel beta-helix repeat protein
MKRYLIALLAGILFPIAAECSTLTPEQFGAKGDGIHDDTPHIQRLLKACSETPNSRCIFRKGKNYLVQDALFVWGKTDLEAEDQDSTLTFAVHDKPYLINFGLKNINQLGEVFTGSVNGLTFKIAAGDNGRILYFWRVQDIKITNNNFLPGKFAYSATSSGNNNAWVLNGNINCIRKNIYIANNKIIAQSDAWGSEGIGLGGFSGGLIENNTVSGVGDDAIGIHYSDNILIQNNNLKSVDGGILINSSSNMTVKNNQMERMAPAPNGKVYEGIYLVFLGFENAKEVTAAMSSNINIVGNTLIYPEATVEKGAAIYIYSGNNVLIEGNTILNKGQNTKSTAIHIMPYRQLTEDTNRNQNLGKVGRISILNNKSLGPKPLRIQMTGNCNEYTGEMITVKGNTANEFSFYCPFVRFENNSGKNLKSNL